MKKSKTEPIKSELVFHQTLEMETKVAPFRCKGIRKTLHNDEQKIFGKQFDF
ncbi:MAG: hypothetical protein WC405_17135 [Syntrophales bacterium]